MTSAVRMLHLPPDDFHQNGASRQIRQPDWQTYYQGFLGFWWTSPRGFSLKSDISMNLPSGIFILFAQKWHFDEPPLGDSHSFHTKVMFWWTSPQEFSHVSHRSDILMNLPSGFSHFSHKSYILMNLPSGILTLFTQKLHFDEPPLGDSHNFYRKVTFVWTSHRGFSHFSHENDNLMNLPSGIFTLFTQKWHSYEPTLGDFHTFHTKITFC